MILTNELIKPPKEFSVMPFWFWNDKLNKTELLKQINDFEEHGVHGFVIHPRVGLPNDLGWMSKELLDFYEIAIKEAEKRQMKVLLYDEGMYPSGSSCGQVVETNPEFQCRCLAKIEHEKNKPYQLKEGENLVAIVNDQNNNKISIIERKVNSTIRGIHYINEGPEEDAPLAADILNPEAVDCFIELVYKKFYERFSSYFKNTIIGIFTDEPNVLGKCNEKNVFPATKNILPKINSILGYDFTPYLSCLWSSDENIANKFQEIYRSACSQLLESTYYSRINQFCKTHNIPLTGHPSKGDDLGLLRYFDIPGQDLVWRWILPDTPSALEGSESTQAKCSSSAMIHGQKRRNLNECCGAYGHELTWEEMMWLGNWCIIRGVNLLIPHAFYYSMRGCRKDERPPDVGPNAHWWNRYKTYADSFKRLSWINTDSQHVCHIAILGKANELPWQSAKILYENQIDFNYIEERDLWETAQIDNDGIQIAKMHYQGLIIELEESERAKDSLKLLESSGRVFKFKSSLSNKKDLLQFSNTFNKNTIVFEKQSNGLRVRHVIKDNKHYYLLFNETKTTFESNVKLSSNTSFYTFNLETGQHRRLDSNIALNFKPHEMKVIISAYNSNTY